MVEKSALKSMEKLPANLDITLRAIADRSNTPLDLADINKLMLAGFITTKFPKGWTTSSKGREYLKKVKK